MNRKLLIGSVAVLALAVVAEHRLVKPVLAQVRAALTQSVDEPGRTPFALAGAKSTSPVFQYTFSVPAGQRYVVENYSVECDVQGGYSLTDVNLFGSTNGVRISLHATPHYVQPDGFNSGLAVNFYAGTGQGPFYADPGSSLVLDAGDNNEGTASKVCHFYVTGHAINNP